jgi:hypothetical protein
LTFSAACRLRTSAEAAVGGSTTKSPSSRAQRFASRNDCRHVPDRDPGEATLNSFLFVPIIEELEAAAGAVSHQLQQLARQIAL